MKKHKSSPDFYSAQRRQWKKSLIIFGAVLLFYFLATGIVLFALILIVGFFIDPFLFFAREKISFFILLTAGLSLMIASVHFYDARKFGASFIRNRLGATEPDTNDRYHKMFLNTLEEMRIASGLSKVKPFVLATGAVNSLAVMEENNTPSILVSEGLLADFTRDELQACIAHELAHIRRGDTFYITLVCSLANFFERLREAAEPDRSSFSLSTFSQQQSEGGSHPFIYISLVISSLLMHLLSTMISRERELLADATAVELTRNPRALARAIYKAHIKNSFIGDFNLTYSPLFIVPPYSKSGESDSFLSRLFNSHPPLGKRLRRLADMASTSLASIFQEAGEIRKRREKARKITLSPKEKDRPSAPEPILPEENRTEKPNRIWLTRPSKGKWEGPFSLEELLVLPFFSPALIVKNVQEDISAPAGDFPHVLKAMEIMLQKKTINASLLNKCPRCSLILQETYYEGVPVKFCSRCGGKLVDSFLMNRIITRREIAFSKYIMQKALEFEKEFMNNPIKIRKSLIEKSKPVHCPSCGWKMVIRPYTYHYLIPVDKCLYCQKIWFDTDEMEILQCLIERKRFPKGTPPTQEK